MTITKYFIDRARYRAENSKGKIIWLEIDYWNNTFTVSSKNQKLEDFARKLLNKKHKVNLVHKMNEKS